VRELTLILTDFYLDHESDRAAAGWPRLATLETLLARGELRNSPDWRAWVYRRIGLPAPSRIPIASIAHAAHPSHANTAGSGQWWLAHCVHLEAGIDRVYSSTATPVLSAGEWAELEHGFNAAFSTVGFRLVDGSGAHAFILSTSDLDADTTDPLRVSGGDILRALPRGAAAPTLKRLMTEIQMWLHDHPVNIARQERGVATVNGLWIWGGAQCPPAAPAGTLPALHSDDGFLRGLWRMGGATGEPVPDAFEALDLDRDEAMIVTLARAPAASESAAQVLSIVERDWFQPALATLRRGRIACLQVLFNDRWLSLTRRGSWRWWRRSRPWFARLA
jgi:hypothetical protein